MVQMKILQSRKEWLEARSKTIGGSDAAAVVGMSPWMSNTELWEQKTRPQEPKEADSPVMEYGTKAEPLLRDLFQLDYPELKVMYQENNLYKNTELPWAHASLDGWLEDEKGRRGVLEIKTANIMSRGQAQRWQGKIPDNYFTQVLHEMAVYEADFAWVKAQLKWTTSEEILLETKHFLIEREEVQKQIEYLMEAERTFWELIQTGTRPRLILPEI